MMKINPADFSSEYSLRRLTEADTEIIYELCSGNPLYYEYCPPFVTREDILSDLSALPPLVSSDCKFYVGYFDGDKLVAVLDLIFGYPSADTAFIGFFMVDAGKQKKGRGGRIISDLFSYLKGCGFTSVRLAWVRDNPQAAGFWRKMEFLPIKETKSTDGRKVILAERIL